jgi:hypothetical protein
MSQKFIFPFLVLLDQIKQFCTHLRKAYPAYYTNLVFLARGISTLLALKSFHMFVLSPDIYP